MKSPSNPPFQRGKTRDPYGVGWVERSPGRWVSLCSALFMSPGQFKAQNESDTHRTIYRSTHPMKEPDTKRILLRRINIESAKRTADKSATGTADKC